jgi:hypothetical protein
MPRAVVDTASMPGPLMLSSRLPLVNSAWSDSPGERPGRPTIREEAPSASPPMPLHTDVRKGIHSSHKHESGVCRMHHH